MDESPIIFEINPNSGVPIYRQIVDQVLAMVAGGLLREGDLLPSVRQVARDAAVNPMTVSKAYSRLETEGVVRRVRGQGMEVLPPRKTARSTSAKQQFRDTIEPALHRARQLGLNQKQIREVISSLLQDQRTMNESRPPRRTACDKSFGGKASAPRHRSRDSSPARCSACSAQTAAAKRRSSNARWDCCGPPPAARPSSAKTPGTCRPPRKPGWATCRRK